MAGDSWRETTLGEFVRLQRGHDLPEMDRRPGMVPIMGSAGQNGFHDIAKAKGPGVVIGRSGVGSMGVVTYCATDYWPHNTVLYVTDFLGNDERFTYYFLRYLNLRRFDSGSAQASLNRNYIYPIRIRVPNPTEQRAIAHILGTLDDKIELNRRMNETLEAMARALFKSWFVAFDPVRAKAEGRDSGLPQPLADLFPDSFEDSELGEIPKGWRVAPLADCIDVVRGLSYKGSGLSRDGMPMHNLNSIYEGGSYKHDGLKHYEGEYKPHHVARSGDVIVANTEQGHHRLLIGYAAIVPGCFDDESLFSHHIYRVRPKNSSGLTPDYLCHLLNTRVMHDTVSGYANGTTVNMLPIDGLQSPHVLVPPSEIVVAFNDLAEAARNRHEGMVEEARTLAALRDTLLPKLISGALRVRDAERFIGRAV
jgi:type I restriction enzyme S subunit